MVVHYGWLGGGGWDNTEKYLRGMDELINKKTKFQFLCV